MNKSVLAAILMATVSLSACAEYTSGMGNKQMIGAGTGAVAGGLLGSQIGDGRGQIVAASVGTLLGLMVGNSIGKSLDKADLAYAQQAEQRAYTAPVGQTISWSNPQSGNSGTITPVRDGRTPDGRTCREYKQTIYIDGQAQTGVGQACQNTDGTWSIQ